MSAQTVDTYETRAPDTEGWRGVPFLHPKDMPAGATADVSTLVTAEVEDDGGKHDAGPMPPEAPRDPAPGGEDDK
ncbi:MULTISPECIES: hypothetical protein [unclassified Streptomyces]|uniref:hypothetical protein n=1 Tax=unclassified Streptomyces TaxID=2593676 RepID=UPI00081DE1C9|nr:MULTISPECIES: hypothetical protein [unclassified Streptomyces]MYZ36358.1 hypothetical protein [Streptomyces sp. SID4917]SCF82930.1 hypothetical protein GA0115259_103279 [Streptomyces sp. MnatMP-M17]